MQTITNLLGYQITEELYAGRRTLVYRAIRTSDRQLVIVKFLNQGILILNFLCTQAAISLENARLYDRVQQSLTDLQQAQLKMIQYDSDQG